MSGSKLSWGSTFKRKSKRIEVHVEQVNDSLYTLHKPGCIPTMQIIFFHGLYLEDSLDTHLYTWESGDGSCIWPQTWLVEDFPGAHVLTVSYCECVKSAANMYVIGENLTQDLEQGEIGQIPGCPVVLVGHSVGGLVIKKLCLQAHDRLHILPKTRSSERAKLETFLDNIKGIFYYSTPHYGSSHVAEAGDLDSPLFKYFNALNAEASQMNHRFEHLCALHTKWLIHGISESLPTNSTLIRGVVVVPEASARQGHQRFAIVAEDHYSICKPKSKKFKGFTALTYLLVNIQEEDERRRHEVRIGEDSRLAEPSQNLQQLPIPQDGPMAEPRTQNFQHLPSKMVDISVQPRIGEDTPVAEPSQNSHQSSIRKDNLVAEPYPQNLQQLPIRKDGPVAEPRPQNFQHLPSEMVDISNGVNEIISKLENNRIVGIVGMGGSDKTELAREANNNSRGSPKEEVEVNLIDFVDFYTKLQERDVGDEDDETVGAPKGAVEVSRIHLIDSDTKVQRELVAVGRESVRAQSDATRSGSASKGCPKNLSIHMENLQVEKSLRDQLVRLLSLNGQKMDLSRVPAEYKKQFGKLLFSGDKCHIHAKLVNLLEQLEDWMFTSGEGRTKTLHLTKTGSEVAAKLKREANNNSRGPPKEEVEVNLTDFNHFYTKLQERDVGDEDNETVGAPKGEVEVSHIHFIDSDTKVQRELVAVGRKSKRAQSDATVSGSASKGSPKNVSIHMENLQVGKSLRDQLVRLLSLNGQKMDLSRVPAEYKKQFGKPLFSGDKGHIHTKLVKLLEQFKDWMFTSGEGRTKMLHLTKTGSEVAAKLKREANNNSRDPPKEEVEVNLIDFVDFYTKIQERDVGEEDDVAVGRESKRAQSDATVSGSASKGSPKDVSIHMENLQVGKSLRDQLVRLLSLNGQKMDLSRVPAEYKKQFGKPLFLGDNGLIRTKLVNLLEQLKDWMFTSGEGRTKTLHLTKTGSRVAANLQREITRNLV